LDTTGAILENERSGAFRLTKRVDLDEVLISAPLKLGHLR